MGLQRGRRKPQAGRPSHGFARSRPLGADRSRFRMEAWLFAAVEPLLTIERRAQPVATHGNRFGLFLRLVGAVDLPLIAAGCNPGLGCRPAFLRRWRLLNAVPLSRSPQWDSSGTPREQEAPRTDIRSPARTGRSHRDHHAQEGCGNGGGILARACVLGAEEGLQLGLQVGLADVGCCSFERVHRRSVVRPEETN
jgi:hypothetical protein